MAKEQNRTENFKKDQKETGAMPAWYQQVLDQYNKDRNTAAFYKTQGFQKLWRYLLAIIEKDKFQETVKSLRIKYEIPEHGFSTEDKQSWSHPFPEWLNSTERKTSLLDLRRDIKKICLEYGLLPRDWTRVVEDYVFYNIPFISLEPAARNLCFVSDGINKKDSLGHEVGGDEIAIYPVTLHINPNASKRDILNYINTIYKTEIYPLQKKYQKGGIKIGKYRGRNRLIQERDKFIYEHRHLSRKEVVKLVSEKFKNVSDTIDQGSVGKVISLEKQRRKEV